MIKSRALVRAETKLKQLQRALEEVQKHVKLLALKDEKMANVLKKTLLKKKTLSKVNK